MLYILQLVSRPRDIHSEMATAVLPEHCKNLNNTVQNSRCLTVGVQVHCEAVRVGFVVDELTIRWGFFSSTFVFLCHCHFSSAWCYTHFIYYQCCLVLLMSASQNGL